MSFTDQKPFTVIQEDMERNWCGRWLEVFRCYLCGHKFKLGDTVRWVFTNFISGLPPGNPFVCGDCNGDNVLEKMKSRHANAKSGKYWYYE